MRRFALIACVGLVPAMAAAQGLPPVQIAPAVAPGRTATVPASPRPPTDSVAFRAGAALAVEAGSGRIVSLSRQAASVFAADPRVAEVRPASPTSLFIFGISPGRTTVAALDERGQPVAQYEVTVRPSAYGASEAQSAINRVVPNGNVRAETRGDGIALRGEVNTPEESNAASRIARGYVLEGQRVENRLTVLGQTQVNLRVRIAEVRREVTRQLGINWTALGNIGRFTINITTNNTVSDASNLPTSIGVGYRGAVNIDGLIDSLAQDRLITILAEPNLTAMSGETASFLVGGEYPIPVGQRDGVVTIEFKQYGVSLAFVPTVLSQDRISMRVRPEVSELTEVGAIRFTSGNNSLQVPAITVRRADTTVELGSGQSFAIAGLLQDNTRSNARAVLGLGEIPILGALFRSDGFLRNETELVIIITPYIVRPTGDPVALRSPTEGFTPAMDVDRMLLFRQIARQRGGGLTPPRLPLEAGFALN